MDMTQFRRIVALTVGCLGVGMSYVVNAFNVFSIALKAHFDLSQIQLELLLALMFLGLCASLPGGLVLEKFGARAASGLALTVSVSGYLLCWSATLSPEFYRQHFYLTCLYFLIAGVGGGLTYMASTASNVRNFSQQWRSTVVGVLHAFLSAGPALIMVVYNMCFDGENRDETKHDLGGFFLFLVAAFGVVNLLGVVSFGHYPPEEEEENGLINPALDDSSKEFEKSDVSIVGAVPYESINTAMATDHKRSASQGSVAPAFDRARLASAVEQDLLNCSVASGYMLSHRDQSGMQASQIGKDKSMRPDLLTWDFHLIFWPFVVMLAFQMVFVQNLTIILQSFKEEEYNSAFPYLTPILGTFCKPLLGFVSDYWSRSLSKMSFIIFGCIIDLLCLLLSIWTLQYVSVVLVTTTLVDIAAYVVYTVGPAILIERFGLGAFSKNWGFVMAGFAIMTGIFLFIFGGMYDLAIDRLTNVDTCYGQGCFTVTFIVMSATSLLVSVFAILYYIKQTRNRAPSTVISINVVSEE